MSKPLLHVGQKKIYKANKRFGVAVCGRRFGKTWTIKEWLSILSAQKKKYYWYVAPTYGDAKDLLWEPLKERWDQLGWAYYSNEQRLIIKRRKTQTIIQLKSAEKERSFRGRGLDGIFWDEYQDIDPKTWAAARPALSDKKGFSYFFGTPKGHNHLYELFNDAKTREDWFHFHARTIDSPFFQTEAGKKEIEDAKRDLDPRTYRQEYEATFESFGGLITYAFDRNKHHIDYEYNPELPIYVGQDFNRHPMAGVLFQKVAGRLIAFKEMVIPTSSTDEVCRIIKDKYSNWQRRGVIFRPDATGKRRTSNSSFSDHEIIKNHGFSIQVSSANPRKVDRWSSTNRAFENDQLLINTKQCPNLVKELETLCYKEGTCEIDIKGNKGHVFDAFGYAVYGEFPIIKPGKIRISNY